MELATEVNGDILSMELTSENLNKILDEHGLSDENVRRRRLYWDELCYMTSPNLNTSLYISGSVREGVVDIDNEDSDLDIMIVIPFFDIAINNSTNIGFKVLMSEEVGVVYNDSITSMSQTFSMDLLFPSNIANSLEQMTSMTVIKEVKGPASNISETFGISKCDIDFVPAIKCRDFPEEAEEWRYRRRRFNWPSQSLINDIVSRGCHLVGTGSTLERRDEWRLSFSMAENILVRSFNDTQLKCYFMLKQTLKSAMKPMLGDVLCSYHMKTLMFWLIEETENSFWKKDNLKECFMYCIKELGKRVTLLSLPHYFIARINLVARKLNRSNREIIIDVINEILKRGSPIVLNCITSTKYSATKKRSYNYFIYQMSPAYFLNDIQIITDVLSKTPLKGIPDILRQVQVDVLKAVDVSKSVEKTCPTIFKFTTACIRLSILLTSNISNKESYTEVMQIMDELKQLVRYDMLSGKLKLATVYLKFNRIRECLVICLAVLWRCEDPFMSFHSRQDFNSIMTNAYMWFYDKRILSDNRKYMLVRWISYDVIFSPLEIELVPEPVQEEMAREKEYIGMGGTLPTTLWCYYDPVVYALFLLITCYDKLGQNEKRNKYLKQLEDVYFNPRGKHYLVYPEAAKYLIDYCRK